MKKKEGTLEGVTLKIGPGGGPQSRGGGGKSSWLRLRSLERGRKKRLEKGAQRGTPEDRLHSVSQCCGKEGGEKSPIEGQGEVPLTVDRRWSGKGSQRARNGSRVTRY